MTYAHVGTQIAGQVSVDVTAVEDLALVSFISIKARLLELSTVNTGLGDFRKSREVLARLSVGVNFLDLIGCQWSLSTKLVQGVPDLRLLIAVACVSYSHKD